MVYKVYNFLLPLILFCMRGFAFFSPKISAAFRGREGLAERWQQKAQALSLGKRVLFHVASVGELEQIRPVLGLLHRPAGALHLLSYFSPSILRVYRDLSFVEAADYLPWDTYGNMQNFFCQTNPTAIVLNRYDLWPNFFLEANRKKIKLALLNASTPPQGFWGKLGLRLRAPLYRMIQSWTFVDAEAATAWQSFIKPGASTCIAGNPRVDRVLERMRDSPHSRNALALIRSLWLGEEQDIIIAGSTWAKDEDLVLGAFITLQKNRNYRRARLILIPHEVSEKNNRRIARYCREFGLSMIFYSDLAQAKQANHSAVLVVDQLGILAELYALGKTGYVGGAFGKSVHSLIEPAAHGLPVAFGPRYSRMPEAVSLLQLGGAKTLARNYDYSELADWFRDTLSGGEIADRAHGAVRAFIEMNRGAGMRLADFLRSEWPDIWPAENLRERRNEHVATRQK